jgi:hypothetical protein
MMTIKGQPVPTPPHLAAVIQTVGSGGGPMTNAERQQRWRDKHRNSGRKPIVITSPQPAVLAHGGLAPAGMAAGAIAADAAVVLRAAAGGSRAKVRDVFDAHVRPLSAAGRLQLMRMIVDSLAAAG